MSILYQILTPLGYPCDVYPSQQGKWKSSWIGPLFHYQFQGLHVYGMWPSSSTMEDNTMSWGFIMQYYMDDCLWLTQNQLLNDKGQKVVRNQLISSSRTTSYKDRRLQAAFFNTNTFLCMKPLNYHSLVCKCGKFLQCLQRGRGCYRLEGEGLTHMIM